MSVKGHNNNIKLNYSKKNPSIYFSPYSNKINNLGNLYTEPRKLLAEINSSSKNIIMKKLSSPLISKKNSNIYPQDNFRKSSKKLVEKNDKREFSKRNVEQSYKNIDSKFYLKKKANPNITSINEPNSNGATTQLGTNSNMNTNTENNNSNVKYTKNRVSSKGKNNQNNNKELSNTSLKKCALSAVDLVNKNYIKKSKSKNLPQLSNNNSFGKLINNNKKNNNKEYLSPQSFLGKKKIILKSDKNKIIDNYFENHKFKDCSYIQINKDFPKRNQNNIDNFFTNKYSFHFNGPKIKNDKIIVKDIVENKNLDINSNKDEPQSIEEVHFLYVNTLQVGKNISLEMKNN